MFQPLLKPQQLRQVTGSCPLDLPGLHQGQPRAHGGGKKCWDYTGDDDHLRGIS